MRHERRRPDRTHCWIRIRLVGVPMSALTIFGVLFGCVLLIDWMGTRAHNKASARTPDTRDGLSSHYTRTAATVPTPPDVAADFDQIHFEWPTKEAA